MDIRRSTWASPGAYIPSTMVKELLQQSQLGPRISRLRLLGDEVLGDSIRQATKNR